MRFSLGRRPIKRLRWLPSADEFGSQRRAGVTVLVGVFQVALALGAPLGHAAWGGRHEGVLPTRLRMASGVAGVVIYPLIGLFVLASAGLISAGWLPGTGKAGMWFLTGFFTLGALANSASRAEAERYWDPVSLLIAACCGFIATRV